MDEERLGVGDSMEARLAVCVMGVQLAGREGWLLLDRLLRILGAILRSFLMLGPDVSRGLQDLL